MDNKKELETQIELGKKRELVDPETGEIILVDQITKKIYGQKSNWIFLFILLKILIQAIIYLLVRILKFQKM